MNRTIPLDFSYLKRRIQASKRSYKQLSKEEKAKYKEESAILLAQVKEEKQKYVEDLKTGVGTSYYLLKLRSNDEQPLKFNFDFTESQIEMAKKCINNYWEFPPPDFFDKFIESKVPLSKQLHLELPKKEDVDKTQTTLISNKENKEKNQKLWEKEILMELINNNLSQYEKFEQQLERLKGTWVELNEFAQNFRNFIILHNTKLYNYTFNCDNNWYNSFSDIFEPNPEYRVFYLKPPSEDKQTLNNKIVKDQSCVLLLFEPFNTRSAKLNGIAFYITFDIIDKNNNIVLDNYCLNNFFTSYQYDLMLPNEEYYIVFKNGIAPAGYNLQLFSDHQIENMSYNNYLVKFNGYESKSFKSEHPRINKLNFCLLMKLMIIVSYI